MPDWSTFCKMCPTSCHLLRRLTVTKTVFKNCRPHSVRAKPTPLRGTAACLPSAATRCSPKSGRSRDLTGLVREAGWLAGKPDYPHKLKVPEGYEKSNENRNNIIKIVQRLCRFVLKLHQILSEFHRFFRNFFHNPHTENLKKILGSLFNFAY